MTDSILAILVPVAAAVILLLFVGLVLARLYRRATRETSLVKTGAGGRRVIMDGGTVVVPLLHEIAKVNMKTLRLEVRRRAEESLITKDRMRVDVGVEFYVGVQPTEEGISKAAQTLGEKTFDVNQLREMIEGKLVDGLRSVAARLTMDELHENRAEFVQQVQQAVAEDLLKNGLMLETVSLTALDQTPFDNLDENNAFNAIGMRQLAEVIAESKKRRALIDAEAETAVRQAKMEAAKRQFQIDQEQEEASLIQEQLLATRRAAQKAEIASREADADRVSEEARIGMEQKVREAEITRARSIEVAEQERQILVATKSEEESRARASADLARAEAVKAAEAITTARELAEAERRKRIAITDAEREAEREATRIRVGAAAEKAAAADRAEAMREEANAEADAMKIRAEARKAEKLAEAEGMQALVAAENGISPEIARMKIDLARIETAPKLLAEAVKPAERIESIRIHHISGLGGAPAAGEAAAAAGGPVEQLSGAIGNMAMTLPAMGALGKSLGRTFEETVGEVMGLSAADGKVAVRDVGAGNGKDAA